MKKILVLLVSIISFSSLAQSYSVNTTNGKVKFDYVTEETKGTITGVEATIEITIDSTITANISGKAPVNKITTGNNTRDKHLMSDDFFDEKNHPNMFFTCSEIYMKDDKYYAKGTLKIKDIEKDLTMRVRFEEGEMKFNSSVYAFDFGLGSSKDRENSKVKIAVYIPLSE